MRVPRFVCPGRPRGTAPVALDREATRAVAQEKGPRVRPFARTYQPPDSSAMVGVFPCFEIDVDDQLVGCVMTKTGRPSAIEAVFAAGNLRSCRRRSCRSFSSGRVCPLAGRRPRDRLGRAAEICFGCASFPCSRESQPTETGEAPDLPLDLITPGQCLLENVGKVRKDLDDMSGPRDASFWHRRPRGPSRGR